MAGTHKDTCSIADNSSGIFRGGKRFPKKIIQAMIPPHFYLFIYLFIFSLPIFKKNHVQVHRQHRAKTTRHKQE